jgi:phospholipase/carboxylesterase
MTPETPARRGRLAARPRRGGWRDVSPGLHRLHLDAGADALLYVPPGIRPATPSPLVLLLHGAGATAQHGLSLLVSQADDVGLVLVALSSQGETWDVLLSGYGPDVTRIDRALQQVFDRVAVDPAHLAVGGFSDGASYGLSLGLVNGDLFSQVLAFSPGFVAPGDRHGAPRLFISHGIDDRVLPIDASSRVLVPRLRRAGYTVRYREFEGGHLVPAGIAAEAAAWLRTPASDDPKTSDKAPPPHTPPRTTPPTT